MTTKLVRHAIDDVSCASFAVDDDGSGGDLFVITTPALWRMDPASGKKTKLCALKYGAPMAVNATHVFAGDDKKVHVVALSGKKPKVTAKLSTTGDGAMAIAPSPDGRFVLVVGSDEGGTLKCFELGKPRALWTIGSVRYARTAWTPDGKRFVTASHEWSSHVKVHDATAKGATVIDLGNPHGKNKRPDASGPSINAILMDPSGDRFWFGSDEGIASLELREGAKPDWILRDKKVTRIARGTHLVAGCEDGNVMIVDLEKRAVLETIVTEPITDLDAKGDRIAVVVEGAILCR